MSSKMRGVGPVTEKIKKVAKVLPERVAAAMYQEMQIEATEMKKRCPVDVTPDAPHPGNLRNSIHVEEPTIKGKTISVIVATGAQAPYAVYVHENPDTFHPVGEYKFMESVLNESRRYMAARIARRVKLNEMK